MIESRSHCLARTVLRLEPWILAGIGLALWYPSLTRAAWLWTLWGLVPLLAARYIVHRRLWTATPLAPCFAALLVIGALNTVVAPYTRGLGMLARPLWGMALYVAIVERARRDGSLDGVLRVVVALGLALAIIALGMTNWDVKSLRFQFIIDLIPRLQWNAFSGGFSPNEIGGAMAWLIPLLGGLAYFRWRQGRLRWPLVLAFGLLCAALFLGQSRTAIIGVLLGLWLMGLSLPNQRLRRLLAVAAVGLIVFELLLIGGRVMQDFANMGYSPGELTEAQNNLALSYVRDIASLSDRVEVWRSAAAMIREYPLTGIGMATFRVGDVSEVFAVPELNGIVAPHAHNEILQILADLGLPGAVVFVAIYGVAAAMLWRSWQLGDDHLRLLSAALAGGLLAHAVFGLLDAIMLWDRLAFFFWIMLGFCAAAYSQALAVVAVGVESRAMDATHEHHHPRQPWPERLKSLVLIGLGLYFVYIIIGGTLANYVNLRFGWLSYVAAALFLLLGVASLRQSHGHHHDHEHDHDHSLISWPVLLIVALPLILGTLIPSQPLGAAAVDGDFSGASLGANQSGGFDIPPEERNILDWLRAFHLSEDLGGFAGQPVDLIGFVYHDPSYPADRFMVARFAISCCVADSQALGLPVAWDEALEADTWIHVSGSFRMDNFQGQPQPVIFPDSVEVIEAPDQPYLYP